MRYFWGFCTKLFPISLCLYALFSTIVSAESVWTLKNKPSSLAPSAYNEANAPIDSSLFAPHTNYTHRYNKRFDKPNNVNIAGLFGAATITNANSHYGGGLVTYDRTIDRYMLGGMIGYLYEGMPNTSQTNTKQLSHNIQLGVYSDVFLESHHLTLLIAQSLNVLQAAAQESNLWLTSSTTNVSASYGYAFILGGSGGFLEPLVRFHFHTLFNMSTRGFELPGYVLRSNFDIGVRYQQFLGKYVLFHISPAFRQDIGVIGGDMFARIMMIDTDGSVLFALPDAQYRSYGVLNLGLEFRIKNTIDLTLNANGIYAYNMYIYNGNLGIKILF